MEINDLRYFVEMGTLEHVHRAARRLQVSPAAVTKAIRRLEAELSTPLVRKQGRNIALTEQGRALLEQARKLIKMEEGIRVRLAGQTAVATLTIGGLETHQVKVIVPLVRQFLETHPQAKFNFVVMNNEATIRRILRNDLDIGVITGAVPEGLRAVRVGRLSHQIYVGREHPLYDAAKNQTSLPLNKVLRERFATLDSPLLGKLDAQQANDGWQESEHPRIKAFIAPSLRLIEEILAVGAALAFLPDFVARSMPEIRALKTHPEIQIPDDRLSLIASRESGAWVNDFFKMAQRLTWDLRA